MPKSRPRTPDPCPNRRLRGRHLLARLFEKGVCISYTQAALVDYFAWLDGPDSFSSIGGDSLRKEKRYASTEKEVSREQKALEDITLSVSEWAADIIAIPLREDRTIYVQNLPLDLSRREANKIARVIGALAQDADSAGHDEG